MSTRWIRAVVVLGFAGWLAGCGGGGSDETTPPTAAAPTVGSAGGTISEASGATVVVPAGALDAETTIRIAMDSTGAPALPVGLVSAGSTYVVTPHGGEFAQPVEVRIPVPAVTLQPNQELKLAKADPGGEWVVLGDSEVSGGMLSGRVSSFSFFVPVTITYLLPLTQAAPLSVQTSIDCGADSCDPAPGVVTVTFTATTNNGQVPADCGNASLLLVSNPFALNRSHPSSNNTATTIPFSGGAVTGTLQAGPTVGFHYFQALMTCSPGWSLFMGGRHMVMWQTPSYPLLGLLNMPDRLDVVAGTAARLDAVLHGAASPRVTGTFDQWAAPHATNRAVIDWQRSDDNGASWRVVARSYQDEANPLPYGSGAQWRYWGVRHGFIATSADQGALIRLHACYTPPDLAPAPCLTSRPTRLNVLQQSALPSITDAPRSLLVRTGQTASLSAAATGAPAPTLQWQSRPANSSGTWTDVATGSGATTGAYTTAVLTTADNGVQYRVVATNALGSANSAPVSVSVSDIDVAPTITTQPASLTVTAGNDAAFAIAARGTEALSYQWRFNGIPISGANSPVLRLPAVSAANAGAYSVEVNNGAGSVTSAAATLTVSAGTAPAAAPSIVTQPVAVAINAGNSATFAVGVSGSGPFSYQWLRDGQAIAGATAAFHSLPQATAGDAASYAVRVSNSAGSVTSQSVPLTVSASGQAAPVTLVTQPSPQVQAPGGSATFAVSLTGSGPISYQWLRNGTPIAGATTAVLTLVDVTSSDAAGYAVTVSNPLGSTTSDAASLTVLGAPVIGTHPAAAGVNAGQAATFSVAASGSALRFQWTRNGVAIAGADAASHTTPVTSLADSGAVYAVVVYNGAGVAISQNAVLTVTPGVVVGTTAVVSVSSTGAIGNNTSTTPSLSADGRLVAFTSWADNLVPNVPTGNNHGYVRNLATGVTSLVNQTPAGAASSGSVYELVLAAGGRHVVFTSLAGDLVAGDTNGSMDVFVRDLQTGITTRINVLPDGSQITDAGGGIVYIGASISADGRWVAFAYQRDLLDAGQSLATAALYLRDMQSNTTRRAVSSPTYSVGLPVISNDGSRIVYLYALSSSNVVSSYDVASGGITTLLTVDTSVFPSGIGPGLSLSDNGRFVAFGIRSAAWIPGAAAAFTQVVVLDQTNPSVLTIASTGVNGIGDGHSGHPVLSGDGRFVLFSTNSPGLSGDAAATIRPYLMVRDLVDHTTRVASRRPNGTAVWTAASMAGAHDLSADGSVLAFVADRFDITGETGGLQLYAAPRP